MDLDLGKQLTPVNIIIARRGLFQVRQLLLVVTKYDK